MTLLIEFFTGLAIMVGGLMLFLFALGGFAYAAEWVDKHTKICEWRVWSWIAKAFWIIASIAVAIFFATGMVDLGRITLS